MSYRASNLPADKHCFFGREGGVSEGLYASLNTNLKSRDKRENVLKNLAVIAACFGLKYDNMYTMKQGVSAQVVYVEKAAHFEVFADGVVTDKPDILLCLKTADCAPVLLTDYQNGVIGAAHAGWRGAYKGVVENVVNLMLQKGARLENIAAAIGPCIQPVSFEVGDDMRAEVCSSSSDGQKFFAPGKDKTHFQFDLSGFIEDKLRRLGVENVINSRIDTYPEANGYFSFRRYTHQGLIKAPFDYPTQYSCIML